MMMRALLCLGLLSNPGFGQWNITVIADSQDVQDLFLQAERWPVIVGTKDFCRYDGVSWISKPLPDTPSIIGDFALDQNGRLHYATLHWEGTTWIREYVENGAGWDIYQYPDGGDISTTEGYPSVALTTSISGDTSYLTYAYDCGDTMLFFLERRVLSFQKDTIPIDADLLSPDIQLDSLGNPWIICHEGRIPPPNRTFCAYYDPLFGVWLWETIESTPSTFYFTPGPFLAWKGTVYTLYKPTGVLKQGDDTLRFAWRNLDGTWYREKLDEFQIKGLCVDADGLIHGLAAFADSVAYHVARDTSGSKWDTLEVVDNINGIAIPGPATGWGGGYMLVDTDGYLHAAYCGKNGKLCYATTNPNVGVPEFLQVLKSGLVLIPASHGFYINGYSGEAQIYDPAGRLVLKREIKGKTLIGPISPGIYFVVAGKERARVMVR